MPTRYKIFGQQAPLSNTFSRLYTVPLAQSAVLSTVTACNYNVTNTTFRIAVVPSGSPLFANAYIAYDTALPAQDSIALTLGITMGANDSIQVFAFSGNVSFNAFGAEQFT
jgi:hypothetical protein